MSAFIRLSLVVGVALAASAANAAVFTVLGEVTSATPPQLVGTPLTITFEIDESQILPVGQTIITPVGGGFGGFVEALMSFEASAPPLFFDLNDDTDFPDQPQLTYFNGTLTQIDASLEDSSGNTLGFGGSSFFFSTSFGSGSGVVDLNTVTIVPPVIPEPSMLLVFTGLMATTAAARRR